MTNACVRAGFGDPPPRLSVVALLCDFGDASLSDCAFQCIEGLLDSVPGDSEIIFVANGPSERLRVELDRVSALGERIITISLGRNLGVVAKNLGYEVAQGKYIFSVDGDVVVRETRAFDKCIKFMDDNPETAIVGPCGARMMDSYWSRISWGATGVDDGAHICGYEDVVDFGVNEDLDGEVLDTIPSMFWCVRKSLLNEIGPLNWRFGPFVGSDSDLCFRAKEAGYQVRCVRVPITHLGGGAHSHESIVDLDEVKKNHLVAIYETWHPKLHLIGEYHK